MANITDQLARHNRPPKVEDAAKRRLVDGLLPEPDPHVPKYQQMRIKQVRMTDRMIDELYAVARILQDQRPEREENVTASTVARLCISYTLGKIEREQVLRRLRGSTEEELLEAFRTHLG